MREQEVEARVCDSYRQKGRWDAESLPHSFLFFDFFLPPLFFPYYICLPPIFRAGGRKNGGPKNGGGGNTKAWLQQQQQREELVQEHRWRYQEERPHQQHQQWQGSMELLISGWRVGQKGEENRWHKYQIVRWTDHDGKTYIMMVMVPPTQKKSWTTSTEREGMTAVKCGHKTGGAKMMAAARGVATRTTKRGAATGAAASTRVGHSTKSSRKNKKVFPQTTICCESARGKDGRDFVFASGGAILSCGGRRRPSPSGFFICQRQTTTQPICHFIWQRGMMTHPINHFIW